MRGSYNRAAIIHPLSPNCFARATTEAGNQDNTCPLRNMFDCNMFDCIQCSLRAFANPLIIGRSSHSVEFRTRPLVKCMFDCRYSLGSTPTTSYWRCSRSHWPPIGARSVKFWNAKSQIADFKVSKRKENKSQLWNHQMNHFSCLVHDSTINWFSRDGAEYESEPIPFHSTEYQTHESDWLNKTTQWFGEAFERNMANGFLSLFCRHTVNDAKK